MVSLVALGLGGCVPRATQLGAPTSFAVGRLPVAAIPADVNGDGRPDLILTRLSNGGSVAVLINAGDGSFRESMSAVGSGAPSVPCVADLNGDGKLDIAVTGLAPGGYLSIFFGRGDGSFAEPVQHLVGPTASSPKAGDFNGDGKVDLAVVLAQPERSDASGYLESELVLLFGRGDGGFETGHALQVGRAVTAFAVGDFNGDHLLDLAFADRRSVVSIELGNGNGTFRELAPQYVAFQAVGISSADVNRDGVLDLVLGVDRGVSVLLGRGDGSFARSGDYVVEQTRSAWAVDLDRDGNVDLVTAHRILRGDGSGHFSPLALGHRYNDDSFVAAADFNGDGWPDLATVDVEHGEVNIYLNHGGPAPVTSGLRSAR